MAPWTNPWACGTPAYEASRLEPELGVLADRVAEIERWLRSVLLLEWESAAATRFRAEIAAQYTGLRGCGARLQEAAAAARTYAAVLQDIETAQRRGGG